MINMSISHVKMEHALFIMCVNWCSKIYYWFIYYMLQISFFLLNKNSGSHLILNKERIPSKMTWFNNDFRLMTARRTLHNEQSHIIFHLRKWQDINRILTLRINLIILRSLIGIRKVDYAKMHLTVNLWFFKLQISFLS